MLGMHQCVSVDWIMVSWEGGREVVMVYCHNNEIKILF